MKLWLEIGQLLFNSSLGRVVFLKIWFACAHLKSSGNKPERSDAFLPSQDLLRDDMIIFYHFSSCGWFKRRELRILLVVESQQLQCLEYDL